MSELLATATATDVDKPDERRFYGVAVARVVDNVDLTGQARVQLSLPWMPEVSPWARVAVLLAGPDTGTFLLPQSGDEVLVAFHHGDPNDPFIVGSLWNAQDLPPVTSPEDAQNAFRLRTPLGHDLEFNDLTQAVTLTTTSEHTIAVTPGGVEISTAKSAAKIVIGADGDVAVTAAGALSIEASSMEFKASSITFDAADMAITASTHCEITSAMVDIN